MHKQLGRTLLLAVLQLATHTQPGLSLKWKGQHKAAANVDAAFTTCLSAT
jgi:hypothetical protein